MDLTVAFVKQPLVGGRIQPSVSRHRLIESSKVEATEEEEDSAMSVATPTLNSLARCKRVAPSELRNRMHLTKFTGKGCIVGAGVKFGFSEFLIPCSGNVTNLQVFPDLQCH